MNRKTLIYLGIGAAAAIALYLVYTRNKAVNDIPAPESHALTGKVNNDNAVLYKNANGNLQPINVQMRKGDKIKVFSQFDGMAKVDCDGLWLNLTDIDIDREYRNFIGERLEPEQDLMTGKIF